MKKFSELTKFELWKLRGEIKLRSLFWGDYRNSFGYDIEDMMEFFDGYCSHLTSIAYSTYGAEMIVENPYLIDNFDNPETLEEWFFMVDDTDWIKRENVKIESK